MSDTLREIEVLEIQGNNIQIAEELPIFMQEDLHAGKESITETVLPRIKLLQALSVEVSDGLGKAGQYISSLDPSWCQSIFLFYPVLCFEQRVMFDKTSRKMVCRSDNGKVPIGQCNPDGEVLQCVACRYGQWIGMNKPECSKSINWIGTLENGAVAALSFINTGYKVGKTLNTFLKTTSAPVFGRVLEITSKQDVDGQNRFYVPVFRQIGYIKDKSKYDAQKELYELLSQKKDVVIDNNEMGEVPAIIDDSEV